MISYATREHMDSPLDLIQGNVIQAGYDIFFHLLHGCRMIHGSESIFCHAPVLLNKIQFAVIFWVEVAEVATRLDKLLKLRFLINEVRL
jgi:hypothetical protein